MLGTVRHIISAETTTTAQMTCTVVQMALVTRPEPATLTMTATSTSTARGQASAKKVARLTRTVPMATTAALMACVISSTNLSFKFSFKTEI